MCGLDEVLLRITHKRKCAHSGSETESQPRECSLASGHHHIRNVQSLECWMSKLGQIVVKQDLSGLDACRDRNMAVNLGKNRLALLTAYQDVIDETSDTDCIELGTDEAAAAEWMEK
ncbi:hypothetical protein D9C73_017410 [Collichthys lucidus]|uniref:Uncharacterized protein n=1 Tax=Collichthys lucidus TaxID=240159 RepID=A0A4U5V6K5_COLLU|nr:hypothetical protein D9C73_017410 [Collichthys lucidus]